MRSNLGPSSHLSSKDMGLVEGLCTIWSRFQSARRAELKAIVTDSHVSAGWLCPEQVAVIDPICREWNTERTVWMFAKRSVFYYSSARPPAAEHGSILLSPPISDEQFYACRQLVQHSHEEQPKT